MGKKKKVILPPQLPPELKEDEIEVSDEDVQFVKENREYAGFVSKLDTQSITRHVTRVANKKEEEIEALYEKRIRKNRSLEKENEEDGVQVDPVDALPVKTLDGKLYYRTMAKESRKPEDAPKEDDNENAMSNEDNKAAKSIVKLTKAERRAKLKKSKKEAKKQEKELTKTEELQTNPQAEVLAEVKEEISAEEAFAMKKCKLAELGMALLADPESNIKFLKEMLQISKDEDHNIVKLGLLSLLAVFKDIIPGYRIRLPTEKEQEMTVSKAVRKTRYYESTLLSSYKAYLQKLIALEKQPSFQHVAVRCICALLDAVPHFNFSDNLLVAVVKNISSFDDVIRKLCCATVKSLFANEGKHGGEATGHAVHLIADHVKVHDCQLHPDSIEVFLSLTFAEDLGRSELSKDAGDVKGKKNKRKKNAEELKNMQVSDRKKSRQELLAKTRAEVHADLKAVSFAPDIEERRRMQSETLSAVFQTYFRILKHTLQPTSIRSKVNASSVPGGFGAHPLLAPCLDGLGKFSHLIDLDFMGDLMNCLKKLACGGSSSDDSPENCLTVSERLRCCIVAFKVMRSNLDALNVDLNEFYVQLYNLLLEYRPNRADQGEVLAEALKTLLCEGRQHDMQRAAAFIKRLCTFSLCFGSAEAMAALVTLRHLLQKNVKCRNLLENDVGGGSLSGLVAKYQPYAMDPNLSGALASVLWELSLLSKHYHPSVSTLASSISNMGTGHSQAYLSTVYPQQAFADLLIEKESFDIKKNLGTLSRKMKSLRRSSKSSCDTCIEYNTKLETDDEIKQKLSNHFIVLKGIAENERLRKELNRTVSSLKLYEEYKKQKRKTQGDHSKARKKKRLSSV
ncbi:PREDICTED: nucleolar complex protein 3 homolog [Nelumbo nucifera]|uniref:Nucleolar complex protein 3 homolog n=1 Tax=Nelumbo nucifera TaxID=4432 RepID=A0A1U8Q5C5_NELNU|nr:PREDICTED: nucleolar complex protein 3 homolog [Nelumbo nucifera]XP_019053236.1 PREDICTED: nucleolar complex protein 3 homolog [Nelumbo nucifera]XP_019053237.1 PREDICTED: nucleolar complex protein 3 homolog [Nelumbo nucifera]